MPLAVILGKKLPRFTIPDLITQGHFNSKKINNRGCLMLLRQRDRRSVRQTEIFRGSQNRRLATIAPTRTVYGLVGAVAFFGQ